MFVRIGLPAAVAVAVATSAWAQEAGPDRPSAGAGPAEVLSEPARTGVTTAGPVRPARPASRAGSARAAQSGQAGDEGWRVEIAPIYVWAPMNISTVTLPSFPGLPAPPPGSGEGDRPSGQTGTSLNGAAMAAFRVAKSRWELNGNFVWAGLSAERKTPYVEVSGNLVYGELLTGVRVVNHLYLEAGVRRIAVDVSAQVLDYPEVKRKPGVWDPVIGATYRAPLGAHWVLTLHGDGGGFGVGSEVDANARVLLDWNMARHVGLALGYQYLYLRVLNDEVSVGGVTKTLKLGTSFSGPIVGVKLLF